MEIILYILLLVFLFEKILSENRKKSINSTKIIHTSYQKKKKKRERNRTKLNKKRQKREHLIIWYFNKNIICFSDSNNCW
jgi:hypothetical protein